MIDIHNGIIAACTRNAQSKNSKVTPVDHSFVTTAQKTARLTLEERLAAVTKGKNNRPTPPKPVPVVVENKQPQTTEQNDENAILIQQAFDKVSALEDVITGRIPKQDQDESNIKESFEQCKQLHSTICSRIPDVTDPSQLGKS